MAKSKVQIDTIIKEAIDALRSDIEIDAAILFGSYASGRASKDSDIDLAVFSKTIDKWSFEERLKLASKVRAVSPLIELHLYSNRALKEARPTNFYGHIIETGKKVA